MVTWLVTWKPSRRAVPLLFGSYCGCSDSREVCTSRSAMPVPLMAASTVVICLALASLASCAVLPWLVTPMRITAMSGATATVASPVTVTSFSAACADSGASAAAAIARAKRVRQIAVVMFISPAHRR